MGVRGELFSTKVQVQNRTYFFNVKENRLGDLYLNIVESKNKEPGNFERQSIVLFADDLQGFLKSFDESLHVLEKAVREKKHAAPKNTTGIPKLKSTNTTIRLTHSKRKTLTEKPSDRKKMKIVRTRTKDKEE
jgi:hypothetical protein